MGEEESCVISSFRREVYEICALLGYYAAYSGNSLPTFQDNLSIRNFHYKLRNIPEKKHISKEELNIGYW
jgi:hypothetical protein